jgi:Resolvase, N terminal domain
MKIRKPDRPKASQIFRCAIYTRKSSDEGLEQEFNSLDAQREACEAYVTSQRHAGWIALPDMYDDGGLSGGTMDRPALRRLLADVKAGKVQIIVVYKVDRLTRSLADFAKIVDVLDAHDAPARDKARQAFHVDHEVGVRAQHYCVQRPNTRDIVGQLTQLLETHAFRQHRNYRDAAIERRTYLATYPVVDLVDSRLAIRELAANIHVPRLRQNAVAAGNSCAASVSRELPCGRL